MTFVNKKVTTCRHQYGRSQYGYCTAKVRQIVEQSLRPITAAEIGEITGIKVATCRKCLTRLARKGFIRRRFHGSYTSLSYDVTRSSSMVTPTAGKPLVIKEPEPRLHCLRLRVFDVVGNPKKWKRDFGFVKVKFQRYANAKAQVFVDCSRECSLDYIAFRFLLEIALREVGQEDWGKVLASSYEFNHDYEGLRLDGVKAVTLTAFDGSFRRVYAKRHSLERRS